LMDVQNLQKVVQVLQARAAKARTDSDAKVAVGYSTGYAIYVHEDLEATHKPGKQAKYLEAPAREMKDELAGIVRQALRQGKTLAQSLLLAGLRLQRESMLLVPVDTGALRASAYTRLE